MQTESVWKKKCGFRINVDVAIIVISVIILKPRSFISWLCVCVCVYLGDVRAANDVEVRSVDDAVRDVAKSPLSQTKMANPEFLASSSIQPQFHHRIPDHHVHQPVCLYYAIVNSVNM